MKIAIYAETPLLEQIAKGQSLDYLTIYSFQVLLGDREPPKGKFCCGEFTLEFPSRNQAVSMAHAALQAEAFEIAKDYEDRIKNLLALTWEAPNAD